MLGKLIRQAGSIIKFTSAKFPTGIIATPPDSFVRGAPMGSLSIVPLSEKVLMDLYLSDPQTDKTMW